VRENQEPATGACVLLLCGPAFAGKSTFAESLARQHDWPVVSTDEITQRRGLRLGDGVPVAEAAASHRRALAEVAAHLEAGSRVVVVDDTNCYRFLRDDYRRVAAAAGATVVLAVFAPPEEEIRRRVAANEQRSTRAGIRPEVLEPHLREFEWPGPDEDPQNVPQGADPAAWAAAHLPRATGRPPER
jgi:predicted kinase